MYVALCIFAVLALLGFGGWFASKPDWEPGIGIVTSIAGLITLFLNDEGRKAKSKSYSAKRREDVSRGLDRIKREGGNLRQMANAYRSEEHRAAVEVSSLELLERELSPLESYWTYRGLVRRVLAEIAVVRASSPMSVSRLLPLIESLETRLSRDQSGRSGSA